MGAMHPGGGWMKTVAILAGGKGTRLRNTLPNVPKPLAPVAGRPFIFYIFEHWISHGVTEFFVSVGHQAEKVIDVVGKQYKDVSVTFCNEEKPLGTGGATIELIKQIKKPFILVNGDTYFPLNLNELVSSNFEAAMTICFAKNYNQHAGERVFLNQKSHLVSAKPSLYKKRVNNDMVSNSGTVIIQPHLIPLNLLMNLELPLPFEEGLVATLIDYNVVIKGLVFEELFIDIGIPADYLEFTENFSQWRKN